MSEPRADRAGGGQIVHNVSRGVFYLSLEKAAAIVSGLAYLALLARWLGPTKYGTMVLALSFTGLATMATGNLEMYLERYAAEYEARGLLLTLRRAHLLALFLKGALGVLAAAALWALAPLLAVQFSAPELAVLLPLLAVSVVFDGPSTTGRATLYGLQQFRWVSVIALCFHVAKTLMVGLLWWFQQGLVALAIGFSALSVLQGVAQSAVPLWMLRRAEDRDPQPRERRSLLRGMIDYCLPLLGARATFLSGQNLGKIILGKLFDMTTLGYFSFAFQTVERFVELAHTLPSSLLPSLTQLVARGERKRLEAGFDRSLRVIQGVAAGLTVGLFLFAHEYTLLVGSPLFAAAVPFLQVLALVPLARTAQQPLTMLFQAMRRPATVLRLALVKFATEFGCYVLLVPPLGILGAAWANVAGAVVSYVAALAVAARLLPGGAGARGASALRALVLAAPFLAVALVAQWRFPGTPGLLLRIALVPFALAGVFGLGLVTREDLERLSALPLQARWMRGVRDATVGTAGRLARAVESRRVP